jgi:hypothetical protein
VVQEKYSVAGVRPGAINHAWGQGFFSSPDAKNGFYNDIFQSMNACDPDIREKLSKLFHEFRRVNREADKLLREQDRRWFGWV